MPAEPSAWEPQFTVLVVTEGGGEGGRIQAALVAAGLACIVVDSGEAAINVLDSRSVDALVSRMRAPRISGLQLLALVRQRNPEAGAVLIIAPGEDEAATLAMDRGVIDFQPRPLNAEKLAAAIRRLADHQRLVAEVARVNRRLDDHYGFAGIVGATGVAERMLSKLKEIAPLETNVLVVGEPGSGKDLVAQVLHQNSPRRNAPFVKADCAALSARLLSRELFGSQEGARGGRRPGRFESAAGGTLYLDAVAAAPTDLQARVAEIMRTRQLRPDLDGQPVEIHVRLVAGSDMDLEGLLEARQFHEGLYQIISETRIDVPPLRHRRRDIPALARHFLDGFLGEQGAAIGFSRDALDRLESYDWPDNVRELREVVRELSRRVPPRETVHVGDLPLEIREHRMRGDQLALPPGTPLSEAERRLIEGTIRLTRGNRERAAEMLGIGLRTLYRKLKAYRAD
ncbi:MAG: sigma-54 dependent transcriptional regulator [Candidatus Eisenbacteria bacterium]